MSRRSEGLPNRMASVFKVVAVCRRWYLFQVLAWLEAHLRLADWMVGRQSGGADLRRRSADARRRTAVGGRGSAVGGRRSTEPTPTSMS